MSNLPDNNGDEATVWIERARMLVINAGSAADLRFWPLACHQIVQAAEMAIKAVYIDKEVPVPRTHNITALLADCPAERVKEQVTKTFGEEELNIFSGYYIAIYPDAEDADQGIYLRCKRVTDLVMQVVEEALA